MVEVKLTDSGEETCRPGHRYGPRMRNYILMHAVIKGKGVHRNDFGVFPIKQGQAFFIFPEEITVYQADTVDPWHYVWTGWTGEESLSFLEELGVSRQSPILDLGSQAESIYACMRRIYKDSTLLRADLAGAGGVLRLLALMSDCRRADGGSAQAYYNRALWLMEHEQSGEPLTVETIAAGLGISRSQLFRVFRDVAGYSPKEALTRHRCEQALHLIRQTALSLENIAVTCGFAGGQHLCDTFRRQGLPPPSSFRK